MNTSPETQPSSTGLTRRRLVGSAATVGAIAAADLALPPNVRKALAQASRRGPAGSRTSSTSCC